MKKNREIKPANMTLSMTLNTYTYMDILISLLQEKFECNTIEKTTDSGIANIKIDSTIVRNTTTKIKFRITTTKERPFLSFLIYIDGQVDYNKIVEFVTTFIKSTDVKLCIASLPEQTVETTDGATHVYWLEYNHFNPEDLKDAPLYSWEPIKKEILVRYVENPEKTTKEKLKDLNEKYSTEYKLCLGKTNDRVYDVVVQKIANGKKDWTKLKVNHKEHYFKLLIDGTEEIFYLQRYPPTDTGAITREPVELRRFDKYLNKKGYRLICNGTSKGSWPLLRREETRTMVNKLQQKNCFDIFEYSKWNEYDNDKINLGEGEVYIQDIKTKKKVKGILRFNYETQEVGLTFDSEIYRQPLETYTHFEIIRNLDEILNKKGLRLICNATSIDVWPIGLSGNMGFGMIAVWLKSFEHVSCYEYSLWNRYATRKQQEDYMNKTRVSRATNKP